MAPSLVTWKLLLLSIPMLLLAAGAMLIKIGWWPRRRGDEPSCVSCGYLLIGNQSGRCPECGGHLNQPGSIRRGTRWRRPGMAMLGALLVGLGLLTVAVPALDAMGRIDWYRYCPATWLVQDVQSSNLARATAGWRELDRRKKAATLAPAIEQKLIVAALAEQAKPTPGPVGQELVDFLGDAFLAKKLSAQQADRFFTQAARLTLRVRPVMIAGDNVPYWLEDSGRGPSGGTWWHRLASVQEKVGDQVLHCGGSMAAGSFGGGRFGSSIKVTVPGKQMIQITDRLTVFNGPFNSENASTQCHSRDIVLQAEFLALDKAPPDYVKLIDDPSLKAQIQQAIAVTQLDRNAKGQFVGVGISLRNAPVNLAFDVFARVQGKERALGSVAANKGTQCCFGVNSRPLNGVSARNIDFVLRSSEAAARQTVDLVAIWKGDIVIEGVPVREVP